MIHRVEAINQLPTAAPTTAPTTMIVAINDVRERQGIDDLADGVAKHSTPTISNPQQLFGEEVRKTFRPGLISGEQRPDAFSANNQNHPKRSSE